MRCVCKTASAPHKSLGVLDPIWKTLFEQDHPHKCRGLGDHGLCHPVGVSRPNVLIPKFGIKPTPVRYRPTVVLSPTWTPYRRCSRPLQTPHAAPKYRIAVGHCRHLAGSVRYSAAGAVPSSAGANSDSSRFAVAIIHTCGSSYSTWMISRLSR